MKKWKRGRKRIVAFTLAVVLAGTAVDLSAFTVSAASIGFTEEDTHILATEEASEVSGVEKETETSDAEETTESTMTETVTTEEETSADDIIGEHSGNISYNMLLAEHEHAYDNGFCQNGENCYEPAVLNDNSTTDDSTDDYYEIGNAGQLYWFMELVNSSSDNSGSSADVGYDAVLTANIVVNEGVLDEEGKLTTDTSKLREWFPIGYYYDRDGDENWESISYTDTFDGQGHTISGLYFDNAEQGRVGLFGQTGGGVEIKNVGVTDIYISGASYVGGICGENYGSITNCYSTGTVSGSYDYIGGVCGLNYDHAAITNSYHTGEVRGSYNGDAGGVCGLSSGTIMNCYSMGTVSGGYYVGGICGENYGSITNCYSMGTIGGSYIDAGGVCGYNYDTITNCYYNKDAYTGNPSGRNEGTTTDVRGKTAEQFAGGEVAYLLQEGQQEQDVAVWGQNIDNDNIVQAAPVLNGAKVYLTSPCPSYSNSENHTREHEGEEGFCKLCGAVMHEHEYDDNGFCTYGDDYYEPAVLKDNDTTDDSTDDYYEIGNAGQLYWFMELVNSLPNSGSSAGVDYDAVLTADIVINEGVLDAEGKLTTDTSKLREWFPIGYCYDRDGNGSEEDISYTGTFDGRGYTISGLYFDNAGQRYVGLFGRTGSGAEIKNVGVTDIYISGNELVGGVCGENYGCITNCYSIGTVSGSGWNTFTGGVCGRNWGTITNSYHAGTVSGDNCVGGICGNNDGSITNCYNIGTVSGSEYTTYTGGVCGKNDGSITNCYHNSDDYNGSSIGSGGADADAHGKTTEQFASGEVAYLLQEGQQDQDVVVWGQNIDNDNDNIVQAAPVLNGVKVYITSPCPSYSNHSENQIKEHEEEEGFCKLCGEVIHEHEYDDNGFCKYDCYEPAVLSDNGTTDDNTDDYYEIGNAGQLYWFMELVNSLPNSGSSADVDYDAVLTADIVINEGVLDAEGKLMTDTSKLREWFPIGYCYDRDGNGSEEDISYTGTFDGQGYTISGLYFDNAGQSYVGLFGRTGRGAEIKNVGVTDIYISGSELVGGVCGENYYKSIITNCYSMGTVSGSGLVGGVCGENYGGSITNCYHAGTVSGDDGVGGICGENYGGSITNCYHNSDDYNGSPIGAGEGTVANVSGKTAEQFAGGEVAYLLREGQQEQDVAVWGQNIDNGNIVQAAPVLNGAEVYITSPCPSSYSNSENQIKEHEKEEGFCKLCGAVMHEHEYDDNGFCKYGCYELAVLSDNGTEDTTDDYYEIGNAGQLLWFAARVNSGSTTISGKLMNDINLTDADWTPIGSTAQPYTGIFDGQGHRIKNMKIASAEEYRGMFGVVSGDVQIENVIIDASCSLSVGSYSAALVGGSNGYGNVTIKNCGNEADVSVYPGTDSGNLAGIFGVNMYSEATVSIINCYNTGTITGSNECGTISGWVGDDSWLGGSVRNCWNSGTVTGGDSFARGSNEFFDNCYNLDSLTASELDSIKTFTAEQLKNGELTWLLNGSSSEESLDWYQTLGTDDYPVLDGGKVYRIANYGCPADTTPEYSYSNSDMDVRGEEHSFVNGYCEYCEIDDHQFADNGICEICRRRELTVTEVTAEGKNYDGTNKVKITSVTLNGMQEGDEVSVDVTDLYGALESADAGTYDSVALPALTLTGADADQYAVNHSTEVAITGGVEIVRADAEITVETVSYDKTFGDAAFTLNVTDTNGEADVQYAVTAGDDVISVSNGTVTIEKTGSATIEVSLPESTNYNAAESKTITVNVAKKSGYTVDAINRSYLYSRENADTIDIAALLPTDCGTVNYGAAIPSNAELFSTAPSVSDDGELSYTVKQGTEDSINTTGTIAVTVTTDNYADITVTVNVKLTDQIPVSVKDGTAVTLKNDTLTYGEALSKLVFNDAVFVDDDGNEVAGTLAWKEPTATPNAGTASATWVFTPENENYAALEGTVAITVNQAVPAVSAVPTVAERVYSPSVVLADSDLTGGSVTGVDGKPLDGTWRWESAGIIPVVNNSGYVAVFTPDDTANYEIVTKTIAVNVAQATPVIGTVSAGDLSDTTDAGKVALSRTDETFAGTLELTDDILQYGKNTYDWKFTPDDGNYKAITGTVEITVIDTKDPTATYQTGTDGWKQFVNTITFGLFCKDYRTVEISYSDEGSGVATKQYYIADKGLSNDEIAALSDSDWKDYTSTINLNATGTYFIYVKVSDVYGNEVTLNSEGIAIYAESTVSPEASDYVYRENKDCTVKIAMNGNTFAKLTDGEGKEIAAENYAVDNSTGELTLKAAYLDTLGKGEYTYSIYMNPQGVETDAVTLAYSFAVNVKARELTVTGATAASRNYDGTNVVEITGITLDGAATGDTVSVDLTGVQGTLISANAGNYTSITLPELALTGEDAGNYTLVQPTEAVKTNVTINKLDAEITVGTDSYDKTFGDAAFALNVTDTNGEADVQYKVTAGEDVVSVFGGTVTIKKAGSAMIEVSLPASTNYNATVSKTITVTVEKKSGYTVGALNKEYLYLRENADTIDIAALLPTDCGTVNYGAAIPSNAGLFSTAPSVSDDGKLSYTVKQGTEDSINTTGTIAVTVTTDNYADITVTVNVKLTDQIPVSVKEGTTVTLKNNTLTYGEALSELEFDVAVFVGEDGKTVEGKLAWKDAAVKPDAGTTNATWVFTPNNEEYAALEGTAAITVNKAVPKVDAVPTVEDREYHPSAALVNGDLKDGTVTGVDGNTLDGTWSWERADIIPVVNNSGYVAVFTPGDTTNYETVTETITVNVAQATPVIGTVSAEDLSDTTDASKVALSRTDKTFSGKLELIDDTLKYGTHAYDWKFTPEDTDNYKTITGTVEITVTDTKYPTATYRTGTDSWKEFVNTITFGLFCKDYRTVEIKYSDEGSGVATKQYCVSDKEIADADIASVEWEDYTDTIYLDAEGTYFIYVKVSDVYGNQVILNSEGIVIYAESTISPETFNYVYKENKDCTVQITMKGNTFAKLTDGEGKEIATENYSIGADGKLALKAAYLDTLDKGEYTYSIYMNPQGVQTDAVTLAYSFAVNVKARELTVTGATAASRNYNGTNAVGITSITLDGVATGDTVSIDLTGVQGTLSSANAGSYTSVTLPELTLTGEDAGNYTLVQPAGAVKINVTINKLDAEITVGTDSYDKTFGDAAFALNVTDTNGEADVQYKVTAGEYVVSVFGGTVTIKKAGSATIEVSLPASTNYNAAESKTITVNVAKKSGYTVDAINRSYLYLRENADTIDVAALLPADCGTVNYGAAIPSNAGLFSTVPSVSDDGKLSYTVKQGTEGSINATGTITVTVTTDNYADITVTVNVKLTDQIPVSVKDGTAVTLKNNTLTYGEALSKLEFNSAVFVDDSGNEVAGTLAWKDAAETPDAGTTSATWVFTPDNENYAALEGTAAITVNKAVPKVDAVPTVDERVYHPSVALKDSDLAGGTVTGVDGTVLDGTWSWQTAGIIPIVNNSGYEAVFTPSDTTNYETVTGTITVTVAKAAPVITSVSGTAITYGDTLSASTLSGSVQYSNFDNTTVAGSFAWKDTAVKPTAAESGITAYAVVFTPSDMVNYNTVETTITLTVNKAENAPNMPGSTMSVPYSSKTVSAVALPEGWAWQDADKNEALKAGVVTNATAVYIGTDKGNYENESVTVAITRSDCGHTDTEVRNAKDATCEQAGYTGDTYCKDCDVKTASGTATAALGHDYTGEVTKEPTTTEEGERTYTCTRCDDSYTESIPKLPEEEHEHSYSSTVTKEPACTETGIKTYTCSCGDSYTETIAATNHSYTSEVTKEPTATEEGIMTYTCSKCGHTYTQAIEKLPDTNKPDDDRPDNKPDTEKPFIKDDKGKEGWDVIRGEVQDAKDEDTVTVDMNGTTVAPGDVFDDTKGRDVTVVFDMGNGITWSVNGKDITSGNVGDIDFSVKVGTEENPINNIPAEVVDKVTGERYFMNVSLAYDGEFGFTAVLSLNVDAENAGLFANLYYYNEQARELEFICADKIAEDGTTELAFTHASEYTIIIDANAMEPAPDTDDAPNETETDGTQDVPKVPETSDTTDDAWRSWWIILLGAVIMVIGFGVFFVRREKAE